MDKGNNDNGPDQETPDERSDNSSFGGLDDSSVSDTTSDRPDPPMNWRPDTGMSQSNPDNQNNALEQGPAVVGKIVLNLDGSEMRQFEKARKYIIASQFVAIVSLFFGGILLSCIAIVIAVVGYRQLSQIAMNYWEQPFVQMALKRPGVIAIGMGVLALIVNAVALFVMYPMIMQTLQDEGFAGLIPGLQSNGTAAQLPSETSLFG